MSGYRRRNKPSEFHTDLRVAFWNIEQGEQYFSFLHGSELIHILRFDWGWSVKLGELEAEFDDLFEALDWIDSSVLGD